MDEGFQERTWVRITGMNDIALRPDRLALKVDGSPKARPQAARILHVTCKASDHQLNKGY